MNVHSNDAAANNKARLAAKAAGYEIGECLGEGSFKVCFAATTASASEVAFKILKPNAEFARTERELAAMRTCAHPNIARCLDSGSVNVEGDVFQYVVESRFKGGSLKDRLVANGPLQRDIVISIGEALIDAMKHIAQRNLVHRDIKPDNIMFSSDGQPILTDFGIVRSLSERSLTDSAHAYGLGTPSFMPAEQYFNLKSLINWRADQFALGVTLSIASIGLHPFGDRLAECVEAIARYARPTERFISAAQAARLGTLIRMLEPYPIQRYSDFATLEQDWSKPSH